MNLETLVLVSELIASIAVIISLIYLAKQVKQSNRINSANSRHSISEFALEMTKFRAEHSDRWTKIMKNENLSEGDLEFRNWNQMMLLLHAETYFHHYKLKLMPENHWQGYTKYVIASLEEPGFIDYWKQVGPAFSKDFSTWLDIQIDNRKDI